MTKLTPEEKCMLMFALGHATAAMALDDKGKFSEQQAKPWLDLAQKIAGHDVFVQKEVKP